MFRRGRNAKSISCAKNQSHHDYRIATGFETLIGYLYMTGQMGRIMELVSVGLGITPEHSEMTNETEAEECTIIGRNAVLEAYRSGKTIDKLFVLDGCQDGPIKSILRESKKQSTLVKYVSREKLDSLSQHEKYQGVVAIAAAYEYAELEDLFANAEKRGEDPFFILCDEIEDPHNLGAIIRTANLAGAHGVIIPKRRAVGLTGTVAKVSAGALHYTPVARVTNLARTIDELKERGMWFVCGDMDGELMYHQNLTGSIGLVIGNEGNGVSRLVKEKCDYIASIPMKGDIDSLNASVATGVLAFEIVRQRMESATK